MCRISHHYVDRYVRSVGFFYWWVGYNIVRHDNARVPESCLQSLDFMYSTESGNGGVENRGYNTQILKDLYV